MITTTNKSFIVVVRFLHSFPGHGTKDYDFKCNLPVKQGNIVVVDTVNGLQLAEIVGVKIESAKATKWVVCIVDLEEYNARREAEKRQADLKRQMEARAKKLQDIERYQILASSDSQMADLLAEYKHVSARVEQVHLAWEPPTTIPAKCAPFQELGEDE